MQDDQVSQEDLDDAIIEDTCHCDLCGGSFVLGGAADYVIVDSPAIDPSHTKLGGQLKLCDPCAGLVVTAFREMLREAGICEHGTEDGDYCEECSAEYKRARGENGLDAEANS